MKKKIDEFKIKENIKILNFVNNIELKILYKNCKAVVMPTYFGPTNIPPLDAWYFRKPLIYSKHLAGQAKNAALLVDPNCVQELITAINDIDNKNITNKLINNGVEMLNLNNKERLIAKENLERLIINFNKIKETWC